MVHDIILDANLYLGLGILTAVALVLISAVALGRFVKVFFLAGPLGLTAPVRKAGSWAVVTGCTDGIGKAYAEKLASQGQNMVLISRNQSKLEVMARDVESKYKVTTRIIAADFSRGDIYDEMASALEGLDVGVLVNNVGCSYDHPEYFEQVDTPDFVSRMLNMNCLSVAKMTHIVLRHMVHKKAGYVINIGSSVGSHAFPFLALYSATKAFVELFSRSLHQEYSSHGITVQCVKPYLVVSKLSKIRHPSTFVPSPAILVASAFNTLGLQSVTTGYWAHALQDLYVSLLPQSKITNFLREVRGQALAKKAMKAKKH